VCTHKEKNARPKKKEFPLIDFKKVISFDQKQLFWFLFGRENGKTTLYQKKKRKEKKEHFALLFLSPFF
jgi:hypothetical protein